jgi:pullulanase/glycogen debranching enzyme
MGDRVRLQTAALATVAFAQGVPFFHAGSDLLRSKSLDRNSYDAGDAFNAIDWTGRDSGFGVGLPLAADNRSDWRFMRPLLEDPALVPDADAMAASAAWFRALLTTRSSSPLFRLRDAQAVQERVRFHNTGPDQHPGLIVMTIDDRRGADVDPAHEAVLVVINASPWRRTVDVDDFAGEDLRLHPAFAALADDRLATAAFYGRSGRVSVPAFTTAVYVLPEAAR